MKKDEVKQLKINYLLTKNDLKDKMISIREASFLNGDHKIQFLKEAFYSEFKFLSQDDAKVQLTDLTSLNENECNHLLLNVLGHKFFLEKTIETSKPHGNEAQTSRICIEISSTYSTPDDSKKFTKDEIVTTKLYVEDFENIRQTVLEHRKEDCRWKLINDNHYLLLKNKSITLASRKANAQAPTIGRVLVLYLLAQAYLYKFEDIENEALKKEETPKKLFEYYEQCVQYRTKYFERIPYKRNRVEEVPLFWEEIHDFYEVDLYQEEFARNLKALKAISEHKITKTISEKSTLITYVACLCTAVSILIPIYQFIYENLITDGSTTEIICGLSIMLAFILGSFGLYKIFISPKLKD